MAAAARREWEEASAAKAEAARQARAELEARGPARPAETRPQAEADEARADEAAAIPDPEAAGELDLVRPDPEIERTHLNAEAGSWPEARAELAADVDPAALTVMAEADAELGAISSSEFDDNLAHARAGAEQLAAQRARDQAGRDRAAVDEPVIGGEAEVEAAAAIDKAEADQDADLEI